jgi:hypothetical protein
MAALSQKPSFVTFTPTLVNTGSRLDVHQFVGNVGAGTAQKMTVTGITLGIVPRISPAAFPLVVGDLSPSTNVSIAARFAAQAITPGTRVLLTTRGTYEFSKVTLGFTVNRFVVIPPVQPEVNPLLRARISVSVEPSQWTYTAYNDEPASSGLNIAAVSLTVVSPVSVTRTPPGWAVKSDFSTHVLWYVPEVQGNIVGGIAPGQSLSGFQLQSSTMASESTPCVLASWSPKNSAAGKVFPDVVLSPARLS